MSDVTETLLLQDAAHGQLQICLPRCIRSKVDRAPGSQGCRLILLYRTDPALCDGKEMNLAPLLVRPEPVPVGRLSIPTSVIGIHSDASMYEVEVSLVDRMTSIESALADE